REKRNLQLVHHPLTILLARQNDMRGRTPGRRLLRAQKHLSSSCQSTDRTEQKNRFQPSSIHTISRLSLLIRTCFGSISPEQRARKSSLCLCGDNPSSKPVPQAELHDAGIA